MFKFFIILICSTLFAGEQQKRVEDLDLSLFKVKESSICEPRLENDTLLLDAKTLSYYNKLSDLDKKIYIRLTGQGFLKKNIEDKPYILIYKKDGFFYMESLAHVDIPLKEAMSVISKFSDYHTWLLRDINVRRPGKTGSYFVDILTMKYFENGSYWDFLVRMNSIFGGLYTVAFNIENRVKEQPVPSFGMHLKQASNLAKTMNGYFRFLHLPCDDSFFVGYFYGDTKLHWMLYDLLPVAVVNSQIGERVETMLENINYKADDVVVQKKRVQKMHVSK